VLDPELQAQVSEIEIDGQVVLLVQPQTFMNRSGESVELALERWPELVPESDLLVVYDDMDLPTGRIRLRPTGGAGGHRGIGDILDRLDTKAVPRLRFGIGHPGRAEAVLDWVLQPFSEEEERRDLPEALARAADAVEAVVTEGVARAMGRFNARRPEAPPAS
jgi:PTH1 family peptidyl-tRNA hydrolase